MLKQLKWMLLFTLIIGVLAGCSGADNKSSNKEITLAYVAWDSEIASTHVVKEVLEQKLGYKVNMLQLDAGPMFAAVAEGTADAMVANWQPVTHADYMERYGANVVDLGPNLDGAKLGLAVPTYMDISSIEDLSNDETGALVDYKIIGIEPGAGLMMASETMLDEYGLRDKWTLLASSSAAMAQELQNAYAAEKPIVVTSWTPHWMFAKMDLKYLDDPKGVYGATEQIHTLASTKLQADKPDAYDLLDRFNWTPEEMAVVMVDILEGDEPAAAAKKWVEANEARVNEWLGQ